MAALAERIWMSLPVAHLPPSLMARQVPLLHLVALTASLASSSHPSNPRNVNAEVPSRENRTFYDPETRSEAVIGYLVRPGFGDLVTDVAHVEYKTGERNCSVEYSIVFDKDMLREYSLLLEGKTLKTIKAKTPPSLQLQRALYEAFLDRPGVDEPWKLAALRARLETDDRKNCSLIKPRFNMDRLQELLTRSEKIMPSTIREKWSVHWIQLRAYSNYISPLNGSIPIDMWPAPSDDLRLTITLAALSVPVVNIIHWVTMGTLKPMGTMRNKMAESL
ncbi:hypothetical protein FOZ63_018459 [Perkinsus olseni]|uniref:Uncharacterized protein n=1 Tax=Perkinsus olseni TaxID=32597 RepID=A0A7J6Q3R7_PEROL|nr:hypothetical protein FOZ63_018459 [Perkinsus olseni]KAF4719891.1 hypothetical protein FOZ62_032092 [Perkinsus olseni]